MAEKLSITTDPYLDSTLDVVYSFSTIKDQVEVFLDLDNAWWQDWQGNHLTHSPMEDEALEVYTLSSGANSCDIYNFSDQELSDEQLQSLEDTFSWFSELTNGKIVGEVNAVLIGNFLGSIKHANEDKAKQIDGLWMPDKKVICLNAEILKDECSASARYSYVTELGASTLDVVLTHELAHVLADMKPYVEDDLSDSTDWEDHAYITSEEGDVHIVSGIGLESDSHPVTSYGYKNPAEDFAETLVFYRFDPPLSIFQPGSGNINRRLDTLSEIIKEHFPKRKVNAPTLDLVSLVGPTYERHAPVVANKKFAQMRASAAEGFRWPKVFKKAYKIAGLALISIMGESYFE